MKSGKEENPQSNNSMYLGENAISWLIVSKEGRWIPKVMKEYFWAIQQTAEPTGSSIPELMC